MQWNLSNRDTASRYESAYRSSGSSCSVGAMFSSMIGSWICGALSGASLMYFFDPHRGSRRRANLISAGEGAFDAARDAAGNIGSHVSDALAGASESASDASGRLSDAASRAAHRARKTSSRWFGRAGDAASDLYDRGSDLYDRGAGLYNRASDATSSSYRRGSKSLSRAYNRAADYGSGFFRRDDDDHHFARTAGIGLGAGLLCAAVGVGLMYFFDPRQGNRRRALVRDRFIHYGAQSRRAARSGRRYATHLGNRARGVAHDARQMLHAGGDSEPVPDERLAARVRSIIGRCVARPAAVRVAASNGAVILSGPCPASEVDRLLADVRQVPGVASIENRLEVQAAAQPALS